MCIRDRFKILSESGVAAGVRRIEGTTGIGILELLAQKDDLISETARELKASNTNDIAKRASALSEELKMCIRDSIYCIFAEAI